MSFKLKTIMQSHIDALATGKEDAQIMCSPETSFMEGDTIQWYFTRTTTDNGVQLRENNKYSMSGSVSQTLTVRNISLSDEGFYYCQTVRNGVLLSEIMPGACLYAYGKLICIIYCISTQIGLCVCVVCVHAHTCVCVCVCVVSLARLSYP